jgi:hypothetical protein
LNHKEMRGLLSDEHFSVDGTQVAGWASMKSFRAKDGSDERTHPLTTALRGQVVR